MAWVRGIKEIRHVTVAASGGERWTTSAGPVLTKIERRVIELLPRAIVETVKRRPMIFLPEHTGAGPCGTRAREAHVDGRVRYKGVPIAFDGTLSPLAWSMEHLLAPLAAWYATYEPPLHFGAKGGPRGRKAA